MLKILHARRELLRQYTREQPENEVSRLTVLVEIQLLCSETFEHW